MTILMLIPDFGRGGAERVFSQLGAELGKRHKVVDCVFNNLEPREYLSGNETVYLDVPGGKNFLTKIVFFFLRVYRLRRIKAKYRVDLAISHLEGADYVNVLSRINERLILCIHGSKLHDANIRGLSGWLRRNIMMPILYRRASDVVCVSRVLRDEVVGRFHVLPARTSVIHNFFDIKRIHEMAQVALPAEYAGITVSHDVIITSGRLVHEKNHMLLIKLMPELLKKRPGVKLVILGVGHLLEDLGTAAETMGFRVYRGTGPLHSGFDVFFLGFHKNPFPYIRSAKVFVLPSLWEGFPLAVCEAMICGTAVIAHDCPTGPREIIAPEMDGRPLVNVHHGEYGVLIPFSQNSDERVVRQWVSVIAGLLEDDILRSRMVTNAARRAFDFRKQEILNDWMNLIERH